MFRGSLMALVIATPVVALEPLPMEQGPEVCRKIADLETAGDALIRQHLKRRKWTAATRRALKAVRDRMAALAYDWDTVIPVRADDLDGLAVALGNMNIPPFDEISRTNGAKGVQQELDRLAVTYGCR